jgi:hypothetical protein
LKPDKGWRRRFEDPIPLSRGRQLVTLEDAAGYIMNLTRAEQKLEEWQTATGCPPRRARVEPRSQGRTLGKAKAEAGSLRGSAGLLGAENLHVDALNKVLRER